MSLPPEHFDGLGVAARKISGSPPHCRPQRLAPFPKSGVSGQKLYSIRRLADEPYWRAIAQDKFGTADETRLDLAQLTQLRNTLAARSRSRSRRQAAAA